MIDDERYTKDYIIQLEKVSFGYDRHRTILKEVCLEIDKGSIVGIVGPSGEGKTTLLRLLNGSLFKEEHYQVKGNVKILNWSVENFIQINRHVGTIYQNPDDQLIFTNVVDEIVFGMENHNFTKDEMELRLESILSRLEIRNLTERNPNHLSGGEKQLVALAAILCLDVEILLLDEAFAAVDSDREEGILMLLESLKKEGKTIIMVEHDLSHLSIADEIYHLEDGMLSCIGVD